MGCKEESNNMRKLRLASGIIAANWLFTTRTMSLGGVKAASPAAIEKTLCHTCSVFPHSWHPF